MIPSDMSLKGKIALVASNRQDLTGTLAAALAEAGASLALIGGAGVGLEVAARQVTTSGGRAFTIAADLTSARQVESAVAEAISRLGRIDILVNGGGTDVAGPLLEATKREWDAVIAANLTAVFLCTKVVGKHMAANRSGSVVSITTCLAERGLPNTAAYSAAHAGVVQLTRALAMEWADHGIRVNAIGMGWMEGSLLTTDPSLEDRLNRFIPVRRRGRPEDLGPMLVYLASDAGSYVTGQTWYVDGGVMAHA